MSQRLLLDKFLREHEVKALRITQIAVRDRDAAMDIVQDSMLKLSCKYGEKPADQWAPLFYRILNNTMLDWQRRQKTRNKWLFWQTDDQYDPIAEAPGAPSDKPEEQLQQTGAMTALETALQALTDRQRQAFLLRCWEGLDIRQTAKAMGCSEGSVKTHYSRALQQLRSQLGDHWP